MRISFIEDVLPNQLAYTPGSIVDNLSNPKLIGTNINYNSSNPNVVAGVAALAISDSKQNTVANPNTLKNTIVGNTLTYAPASGNAS